MPMPQTDLTTPLETGNPTTDSRPATLYARRHLTLNSSPKSLEIAPDLKLEWKSAEDILETPTAKGIDQDGGINCIKVDTGQPLGWVRLCCELEQPVRESLLGVRMLMRLSSKTTQNTAIRMMLCETDEKTGRRQGISDTFSNLDCGLDTWQELKCVFACARPKDGKRIDVMFNLPKECEITLARLDCRWIDATLSGARRDALKQHGFEKIFEVTGEELDESDFEMAAKSGHFVAAADKSGFTARGWVLPVAQQSSAVALVDGEPVDLQLDRGAEIAEGVTVESGFSYSLTSAGQQGAADVEFALKDAVDCPFASVSVPRLLSQLTNRDDETGFDSKSIELFFYPDYTATNPYQTLMYSHFEGAKWMPGDIDAALERMRNVSGPGKVVLHLHWLNPLLAGAKTVAQAEAKRIAFRDKLSYFVSLGGVVLWTVHNVVSHDAKFRGVERALGQDVADLAASIHVHSERLLPILAEDYDLAREKILIEPHPNYIGHYPSYVGREDARARLSLDSDAKVFLFFGQLRPYKGIEKLVKCFLELQKSEPNIHLLIVGNPVFPYSKGLLTQKHQGHRNVRVIEGQIADASLQWYYSACDWVVLPYKNILTSGSLLLAMSFARPCIAPRMGMIPDVLEDGTNGFSYDPEDEAGLLTAMRQALSVEPKRLKALGQAALDTVAPLTWKRMPDSLLRAIRQSYEFRDISLPFEDGSHDCLLMGQEFPPKKIARTAVVILNFEHIDDVLRLVGTFKDSTNQDFDIYVVDNCSPSLSEFDLYTQLRNVHVLRLTENLGYAAGNNAAMRLIKDLDYEFIWILNPDMVVSPVALEQHLEAAKANPDTSIFGPVILPGGNKTRVASGGCMISFENGVSTQHMYAGEPLTVLPNEPYQVDFVTGASVFLRKSVLDEIGYIPEDYFLYFEETNWLLNAGRKGFKCLVLPNVRLSHHKRSEEGGLPAKYYFYYFLRNSIIFAQRISKQSPNATINRLRAGFINAWLKKIGNRAPNKLDFYKAFVERALADGIAGVTGRIDLIELELELSRTQPGMRRPARVKHFEAEIDEDRTLFGRIEYLGAGPKKSTVSIIDGDEVVANVTTEPLAEGVHVFSATLPAEHKDGRKRTYHFYVNGRQLPQAYTRVLLPVPEPEFAGRIDGVNQFCCLGWACNKSDPRHPVKVEILHKDEVIAQGLVNDFRPDLARHNLRGGYAAFSLRIPRYFSNGQKHELSLRIEGEDKILFSGSFEDSKINGGVGPEAPETALENLFYERHYWLARHDLDSLPIGRHIHLAEQALIRKHETAEQAVKVSVVMPVFNRADSVREAIDSVRAQTYANWELLVVDDGSSDDSVDVVSQLIEETGDDRIRLIRLPENSGVSAARNAGLREAGGEIIAYLDSDNVWTPNFLMVMAGELLGQPAEVAAAYCGQRIMHCCGTDDHPINELIAIRIGPFHMALMENRNFIDLNCYVHRREMFEKFGGFNEAMRRLVDWELILRYSMRSVPHFVPALLSNYFFDKADNQITKLENFPQSLEQLKQSAARAKAETAYRLDTPLRPVDVVLLATEMNDEDEIVTRISDVEASLPDGVDRSFIVYVNPDLSAGVASKASPSVGLREAENETDALADALEARRDEADLAVLCNNALPAQGWLHGFNRAVATAGKAGMLISRHTVTGHAADAVVHAPFASRDLDVCIALSAKSKNVLDPSYDTRANLVSLTGFEPFCTYIVGDCAGEMALPEDAGLSLQDAFNELADFTRAYLRRDVVYAGSVQAFDIEPASRKGR
ncbi:GDP-mannose:glycolipid 4-beta-D-mannosyltransferase precursor [Jannaschia seosinensis]|uniref:GDP-mannose:glycolipid 4-beta-D-mannosyltransferase n=1 Tax=Jannaschia seosinensis TaxID=313367 RepID=A0A0M7BAP2_9RHOB|nr:glycosyltransferase [Jannaschia seosinensis]CUH39461.1 GDP-mannose:glycolipid 4-beta-D-mannosyltransferase precursor [Jannaschia seosinensis]